MSRTDEEKEVGRAFQGLFTGLLAAAIAEQTEYEAHPSVVLYDRGGEDYGHRAQLFIEDGDRHINIDISVEVEIARRTQ
jgi:hypothetical protein